MTFAIPLAMIATAAGTGITMMGQAQAAKAAETLDLSQAQYRTAMGQLYENQAARETAAGFQQAQRVGGEYGARAQRLAVFGAAGNIAGPSLQNTIASTLALGQQAQRVTIANAGERAFQEQVRGSEETFQAGQETAAAANVAAALPLQEAGTAISGVGRIASMGAAPGGPWAPSTVGGAPPVDPKWYQGSDLMTDTGPTTGEPLHLLG
jgi:hypothetical protein